MEIEHRIKKGKRQQPVCSVCKLEIAVYSCPRCKTRTCSLECCLSHKREQNCNGKRDRTAYISKEEFSSNSQHLMSDYNFLEDALLVNRRAKRLMEEKSSSGKGGKRRKGGKNEYTNLRFVNESQNNSIHDDSNWFEKRLGAQKLDCSTSQRLLIENATSRSNIKIVFMSSGMNRREKNKSFYHIATDTIQWTIEFVLHMADSNGNISADRIRDVKLIKDEFKRILGGNSSKKLSIPALRYFSKIELSELSFYVKLEPSSSLRYRKLDCNLSFKDGLKDLNIIEFPTIHVVHKSGDHKFPTLVKEVEIRNI